MFSRYTKKLFSAKNRKTIPTFFIGLGLVLTIISSVLFTLGATNLGSDKVAKADVLEPSFCNGPTTPTWNPYPLLTNSNNPNWDINSQKCFDIPLLSFYPINTNANNPREITIGAFERISLEIYYNNGAKPGSASISNPRVKVFVQKITTTKYKISATLTGDNTTTATSAQKGGDLIVNVPLDTNLQYTANSTNHFIDAIERADQGSRTGGQVYDVIPDNGTNSNPLYSQVDGQTVGSTNGFLIKPNGLEAGYLGFGYILSQMKAIPTFTPPAANTPPIIPGQEITIVRGQSGSFTPLNPTDPENNIPIALNTSSVLPSFCTLTGTPNSTGGGQIITCQTIATTPVKTTFNITPTDSLGLVGTPGTFIVNVIEPNQPSLSLVKSCVKKGTQTPCSSANLQSGDEVTYKVLTTNTGNTNLANVKVVDDYDETKLENITNISDSGINNTPDNGKITWNLGTLNQGANKNLSFDAKIKSSIFGTNQDKVTINNIATVTADGIQPITSQTAFDVVKPSWSIVKSCVKFDTQTPCSSANLTAGDKVLYNVEVTNTSTQVDINSYNLYDAYDIDKLENIANISDGGRNDDVALPCPEGTLCTLALKKSVIWENLPTLLSKAPGRSEAQSKKSVSFTATIKSNVAANTKIINLAIGSKNTSTIYQGLPVIQAQNEFTTVALNQPSVGITKTCVKKGTQNACNATELVSGDEINYKVNIINNGNVNLTNVKVVDDYDESRLENITNISDSGTNNTPDNGKITWNIGTLNQGANKDLSFDAKIKTNQPQGTSVVNFATVSASQVPDKTVSYTFNLGGNPALEINKKCFKQGTTTECANSLLLGGNQITYQISIKNTGKSKATNVKVVDNYEKNKINNISNVTPTPISDNTDGTVAWDVGDLNVGESKNFSFNATIISAVAGGTLVNNIALGKSKELPDVLAQASFVVATIAPEVPRTGGSTTATLLGIFGIILLSYGYLSYKASGKVGEGFVPARSKEVK